jgi:hypothetical protein
MICNFVTECCDKNAICDSMIQNHKKYEFFFMMMWCVTPHHINLGLHIPMS